MYLILTFKNFPCILFSQQGTAKYDQITPHTSHQMYFKDFLETLKFQVVVLVEDRATQRFELNKAERELTFSLQRIPTYHHKYLQINILL